MNTDELHIVFNKIKPEIDKRLKSFEQIRNTAGQKELFIELAFCLLTPQSGARRCWTAIEKLLDKNLLFDGTAAEISDELNIVRFRNNKASYIVEARKKFLDGQNSLRELLDSETSIQEKRIRLVRDVKGYGMKEASHFLRNTGFGQDIAILDRHILRNMERFGLIEKIPASITGKKYIELEQILSGFSSKTGIPMQYMDFILWYKETGDIFK